MNSNQDIDRFVRGSNQAIDDLVEIWLDVFFSGSLGLDDASIEEVAENLIDLDALDATGNDNIDDNDMVKSVLEDHNLLQSASHSENDDIVQVPILVTIEQANEASIDLINFFSTQSSLPTNL